MLRWLLLGLLVLPAAARDSLYQLSGRIEPPQRGSLSSFSVSNLSVSIYGATIPFAVETVSDPAGHFRFQKLRPGTYVVSAFIPGRGEARTTVEIGPGTADAKQRVALTLDPEKADFSSGDLAGNDAVSAKQLAVPEQAWHEYDEALRALNRHATSEATAHLETAVRIAPQFDAAWNNLGTIAYQTGHYERAEECFRQALAQRPESFEALVNLGGVSITLRKLSGALDYNQRAVASRPHDALANSQLGMTYFAMGEFAPAEKYLQQAREIDPAHFSHPQLVLAEIHSRQGRWQAAADDLDDFLQHHPDWPEAPELRAKTAQWRRR